MVQERPGYTNRKSCMAYRMSGLPMILSEDAGQF